MHTVIKKDIQIPDFKTLSKKFVRNIGDLELLQEIFFMLSEISRRARVQLTLEETNLQREEANDMLEVIRKDFNHIPFDVIKSTCIEISQGKYDEPKDFGFKFFKSELTNSLIKGLYRSGLKQKVDENKKYFIVEQQNQIPQLPQHEITEEERIKQNAKKEYLKFLHSGGFVFTDELYKFMRTKAKFKYSDVKCLIVQFKGKKKYRDYQTKTILKKLEQPKIVAQRADGTDIYTQIEELNTNAIFNINWGNLKYDLKRELVRLWFEFLKTKEK